MPTPPRHRGRFAPSPTGRLHFGSLVAALGSWLFARAAGGRWLVRIEDLDREREVAGAAAGIVATLAAFGLESDEPILLQSERGAVYAAALARLDAGGHAYRCWCSRSDLEPFGGVHPTRCVAPPDPARPPAWRVRVPARRLGFDDAIQGRFEQDLRGEAGDFVVWRVEGRAAYQLAVVVDDAAQHVSDVVRGADLLDSTPRQLLLQELLGLPRPNYAHLPLVVDADGRKLSKHERALPVDADDPLPALRAALAFLGQPVPAAATPARLLARAARDFDARRIPRASAFAALRKDVCRT
ncbi:MAG TPA: tRNA glutamyl-Q(34) synthetase GluQRS [Dokdonella sp.]